MLAFIHASPNTLDVLCVIAVVLFGFVAVSGLLRRSIEGLCLGAGLAALAVALIFLV